jgi:hypothetical protein
MNKQPTRPKSGYRAQAHPLWMRLLTVFCMLLLGAAGTVQACHSHDDAFEPTLQSTSHPAAQPAQPVNPDSDSPNSTVRCPLCVAMHSALPVTHTLTQVAALRFDPPPAPAPSAPRLFLWRSQLASRPPPSASLLA